MDKYKIESHKLIYHISRVHDWLDNKNIYPIYMEISPSGACNHRCTYCGLDFMRYQPKFIDADLLKKRISELGKLGLKSIMFAGEGEPLLHKQIRSIVSHTKKEGVDVSVTTNGILLKDDLAENILSDLKWIKIGVDAATSDTYSKIHYCSPSDFNCVLKNVSKAIDIIKRNKYSCALGIQFLLLPENRNELVSLAKIVKDIGVDYLVVKPYSQHIQSKVKLYNSIKYSDYEDLEYELQRFNSNDFEVIFRIYTMKKWDKKKKNYQRCLGLPFWSYIDARGNVWGCGVFLKDKRFFYGNIYESTFKNIWEGKKRLKSLNWVQNELNVSQCRVNCRMDEVNRYLWELKNPIAHVNFI